MMKQQQHFCSDWAHFSQTTYLPRYHHRLRASRIVSVNWTTTKLLDLLSTCLPVYYLPSFACKIFRWTVQKYCRKSVFDHFNTITLIGALAGLALWYTKKLNANNSAYFVQVNGPLITSAHLKLTLTEQVHRRCCVENLVASF